MRIGAAGSRTLSWPGSIFLAADICKRVPSPGSPQSPLYNGSPRAAVVKLANTMDSKSIAFGLVGSSPTRRISRSKSGFADSCP
jgi:hypothetical protein